eukprot:TRINITY_DN8385_c0_g1_i1.p1 TRINITY_DN8385_c0_g1~~TRINITY_DN8385_c0_g1_i1.p1  ORF type:complete len:324 (+),score=60.07 TRINITY_DN8385_c0_g1_i1:116-973(+)
MGVAAAKLIWQKLRERSSDAVSSEVRVVDPSASQSDFAVPDRYSDVPVLDGCMCMSAPGLWQVQPMAALCVTEVRKCSELSQFCPQGMKEALEVYSALLSAVCRANSGYRSTVLGDSHLFAFHEAEMCCSFALQAQEKLLTADWPEAILDHPSCRPVQSECGVMLWRGPRVRMGLNYGPVAVEVNPATCQLDYFGWTVVVAATVQSRLRQGGLIGVTKDLLAELGTGAIRRLGDPVIVDVGSRKFRQLPDPVSVKVMLGWPFADVRRALVPVWNHEQQFEDDLLL